ncbi:MAG: hypothetical protein FI707_13490 [SAR202 cluster bacterium]|jgi:hypothetical protein|nr:hypothetical protein [Chloroflexota bacterium]MDP6422611.1 hypothetical protein [SAR202 cluster bacterium]HAL48890.1 hypothetical protein [Dehalococcoidia bacterium]MDP6662852.1 hypothetical protein [SAR202 cluster bacterium]MDP6801102.1 hypothetical protein [SAR202 cluster bacterium]|tara:strand:+ start:6492 stop:6716 length:225 start_codon:yes stop_codon:yes gene_type:complete
MRDLPIVFPISLVVILIAIFFTAAYAISEDALSEASPAYASTLESPIASTDAPKDSAADTDWYQQAAIFVCPLH